MKTSVGALFEGFADYAGLFPPAELSMQEAVGNYSRYCDGPVGFFVDRFVCPVSRLDELGKCIDRFRADADFAVNITTKPVSTTEEALAQWRSDIEQMRAFVAFYGDKCMFEGYEVPIGRDVDVHKLAHSVQDLAQMDLYCEVAVNESTRDQLWEMANSSAKVKIRCGGLTSSAFPSIETLAMLIEELNNVEFSYKLTAGLHHALPFHDPQLNVTHHGFLNVFVASILSATYSPSTDQLMEILAEESIENFFITDEEIAWRDYAIDLDDIEDGRGFVEAIGTCSIDEMLADLDRLGLVNLEELK